MLLITENNEYLNVGDKNAGDKWFELLKQIDKLNLIAKMTGKTIKEDDVKLPEPKPLSESDSLELQKAKEQFDKLMKEDSLQH
ncbi:MAG TPA: hypothetical protein VJY62_00860 [Bacteroidia bacterium]|nr:hypothetical protein [Bacteroidia bacterium]